VPAECQIGKSLLESELVYVARCAGVASVVILYRDLKNAMDFIVKQMMFKLRRKVTYDEVLNLLDDHDLGLARKVPVGGGSRVNDRIGDVLSKAGCVGALLNQAQVRAVREALSRVKRR
jgi:hypothetical protein